MAEQAWSHWITAAVWWDDLPRSSWALPFRGITSLRHCFFVFRVLSLAERSSALAFSATTNCWKTPTALSWRHCALRKIHKQTAHQNGTWRQASGRVDTRNSDGRTRTDSQLLNMTSRPRRMTATTVFPWKRHRSFAMLHVSYCCSAHF